MSDETPKNPVGYSGLVENVRGFLAHATEMLLARLELVILESREAGGRLIRLLLFLAVSLMAILLAYIFGVIGISFLVENLTGWDWWAVVLAMAVLHLVTAGILMLVAKKRLLGPVFPVTLDELRKDREWLSKKQEKVN